MSPFQTAQMYSLQDKNIFNISIDGFFDDCQDIVKGVSNDLEFKDKNQIGAVNSINWGRIIAQVVIILKGIFPQQIHLMNLLMSQFHQETSAIFVLAIYQE